MMKRYRGMLPMRYLVILFLLSLAANFAFARDQHVRGHFRKDGT